jgi:hypothetical protein
MHLCAREKKHYSSSTAVVVLIAVGFLVVGHLVKKEFEKLFICLIAK